MFVNHIGSPVEQRRIVCGYRALSVLPTWTGRVEQLHPDVYGHVGSEKPVTTLLVLPGHLAIARSIDRGQKPRVQFRKLSAPIPFAKNCP
jgi:hypothetical protein